MGEYLEENAELRDKVIGLREQIKKITAERLNIPESLLGKSPYSDTWPHGEQYPFEAKGEVLTTESDYNEKEHIINELFCTLRDAETEERIKDWCMEMINKVLDEGPGGIVINKNVVVRNEGVE